MSCCRGRRTVEGIRCHPTVGGRIQYYVVSTGRTRTDISSISSISSGPRRLIRVPVFSSTSTTTYVRNVGRVFIAGIWTDWVCLYACRCTYSCTPDTAPHTTYCEHLWYPSRLARLVWFRQLHHQPAPSPSHRRARLLFAVCRFPFPMSHFPFLCSLFPRGAHSFPFLYDSFRWYDAPRTMRPVRCAECDAPVRSMRQSIN